MLMSDDDFSLWLQQWRNSFNPYLNAVVPTAPTGGISNRTIHSIVLILAVYQYDFVGQPSRSSEPEVVSPSTEFRTPVLESSAAMRNPVTVNVDSDSDEFYFIS